MAEIRGFSGDVQGLEQLQRDLSEIGKLRKPVLNRASKLASLPIQADAKLFGANYYETGMMDKGIKFKMETPNKRNKSVYRLNWDSKYSDFYKKPIKEPGYFGGKNPSAYYPQSVEWGFLSAKGKIAGKYFVRKAMDRNEAKSLQTIIDVLSEEIEKIAGG
jgi:hypothetical protein